ncbi:DNA adenine methylase [Rahnella sp. BIGb0603]|uniref:DNA adenine methylase n=1 Tax=Rahnella sp. BIGb0603 TaxID=2940612 RepID=UPI002167E3BD|nr:Dam family site-specific DNA-(adenine-N6)-methyltransferase [Rahnella sp. BIGb0603]MCS3425895.1 DNA adenine methylase [Rahnella sp. BIGb0603]
MEQVRTVLKWAGSKIRIMDILKQHLPAGRRLVEPFAGSCAVMMNTDYEEYLIADINPDLINLYQNIKLNPERFIAYARKFFELCNSAEDFYIVRADFNLSSASEERAVMFLYLNRHCFNGLCRYNRSGGFNSPYGKYKAPYFPEKEIRAFAEKAKRATFICCSFDEALAMVLPGDVIYCDPPYLPASSTANFTGYAAACFGKLEHEQLSANLLVLAERSYPVIASNADTREARGLYGKFKIASFDAPRSVGAAAGSIKTAPEIIAKITPKNPQYLPLVCEEETEGTD